MTFPRKKASTVKTQDADGLRGTAQHWGIRLYLDDGWVSHHLRRTTHRKDSGSGKGAAEIPFVHVDEWNNVNPALANGVCDVDAQLMSYGSICHGTSQQKAAMEFLEVSFYRESTVNIGIWRR